MEGMDLLAFSCAVGAVGIGVLVVTYLVVSQRSPAIAAPSTPAPNTRAVAVRLSGHRSATVWRLESGLDHDRISIDVFSQRAVTNGSPTEWRHDLMDTPLSLAPGQTAELPAVVGGTHHEAAVAWFVGSSPERNRDSLFVSVRARDR